MQSSELPPDDRIVGDRQWPRESYALINGALTRLLARLQKWNTIAAEHGASAPPYIEQTSTLLRMVEWGNGALSGKSARPINVSGVTVDSLRLIKAALILDVWQADKRVAESPDSETWPAAVMMSITERVRRCRELADAISYPPASILDEFRVEHGARLSEGRSEPGWDLFVSHASEDKGKFVDELVRALSAAGVKVWYDTDQLTIGDSLRSSIDRGLAHSRFGTVILSRSFFEKEWPRRELDGLAAREVEGSKVILPIWHDLKESDVRRYSPMLADRVGVSSSIGVAGVVAALLKVVHRNDA
jgi:TIR domain